LQYPTFLFIPKPPFPPREPFFLTRWPIFFQIEDGQSVPFNFHLSKRETFPPLQVLFSRKFLRPAFFSPESPPPRNLGADWNPATFSTTPGPPPSFTPLSVPLLSLDALKFFDYQQTLLARRNSRGPLVCPPPLPTSFAVPASKFTNPPFPPGSRPS